MDYPYSFADRLFERLLGPNAGLRVANGDESKVIKSNLFAMSFIYNPKNFVYLKASVKKRSNKVGSAHSSAALLENAIGDDRVVSFKIGSRIGRLGSEIPLFNNLVAKASTELIRGDQTGLIKTKAFARLTRQLKEDSLYGTISLAAGHIAALKSHSGCLRVNDAFYLNNFKGIRNVGYRFDPEAKKKGLGGDILGFDRFTTLNLKLSQINCPLLQDLAMEPFVFANFCLAPNRNPERKPESSWLSRHLRWATGFGLSMQLPNAAVECYYNVHVSRQKNELRNDFQINIGID